MRTLSSTLLAASAVLAAWEPASAAPAAKPPAARPASAAGPVSDVRCLMDMFILAQQPQPQQKQTGQAGILFFAGRISARGGGQDLASAMKAQLPTLQQQQVQSELPRCGAILQTSMHAVETGFSGLRPPGAPSAPQPAAPGLNPAPAAPPSGTTPTAPAAPSPH